MPCHFILDLIMLTWNSLLLCDFVTRFFLHINVLVNKLNGTGLP